MAKNTSMLLRDHFEQFIDNLVASGRYASSSEVVRDALRLLEQRKQRERVNNANNRWTYACSSSAVCPVDFLCGDSAHPYCGG